MTFKGFRKDAPIVVAAIAEGGQSAGPTTLASSQPAIASPAGAA